MRAFSYIDSTTRGRILGTDPSFPWIGTADWIAVENPTNADIYLNTTGPDYAFSAATAQYVVPAGTAKAIPISSNAVAIRFATVPSIPGVSTGLLSRATIIVGKNFPNDPEPMPQYGTFSFATLSASQLSSGPVTITGYSSTSTFDLGAWGGLAASIIVGGNAQALCNYQHSVDGTTWITANTFTVYPGITYNCEFPRYQRFARLNFADTTLGGSFSASLVARATLAEILQLDIGSQSSYNTAYNVSTVTATLLTLSTQGVYSLSIQVDFAGSGIATLIPIITVQCSDDGINWREIGVGNWSAVLSSTAPYIYINQPTAIFTRIRIDNTESGNFAIGTVHVRQFFSNLQPVDRNAARVRMDDGDTPVLGNSSDVIGSNTILGIAKSIDYAATTLIHTDLATTIHNDLNSTVHTDLTGIDAKLRVTMGAAGFTFTGSNPANTYVKTAQIPQNNKLKGFSIGVGTTDLVTITAGTQSAVGAVTIWAGHLTGGQPFFISVANHFFSAIDNTNDTLWVRCSGVASNPIEIAAYYG